MKGNGYAFPVLLAFDFTWGLLDGIAIPQNWVMDGPGQVALDAVGLTM